MDKQNKSQEDPTEDYGARITALALALSVRLRNHDYFTSYSEFLHWSSVQLQLPESAIERSLVKLGLWRSRWRGHPTLQLHLLQSDILRYASERLGGDER